MKTAGSIAAYGKHVTQTPELVGTAGIAEIARRQQAAQRHRGQLKRSAKAAANALVGVQQLELKHIHPRWLRTTVAELLDAEMPVSFELVEALRARGPL